MQQRRPGLRTPYDKIGRWKRGGLTEGKVEEGEGKGEGEVSKVESGEGGRTFDAVAKSESMGKGRN